MGRVDPDIQSRPLKTIRAGPTSLDPQIGSWKCLIARNILQNPSAPELESHALAAAAAEREAPRRITAFMAGHAGAVFGW